MNWTFLELDDDAIEAQFVLGLVIGCWYKMQTFHEKWFDELL